MAHRYGASNKARSRSSRNRYDPDEQEFGAYGRQHEMEDQSWGQRGYGPGGDRASSSPQFGWDDWDEWAGERGYGEQQGGFAGADRSGSWQPGGYDSGQAGTPYAPRYARGGYAASIPQGGRERYGPLGSPYGGSAYGQGGSAYGEHGYGQRRGSGGWSRQDDPRRSNEDWGRGDEHPDRTHWMTERMSESDPRHRYDPDYDHWRREQIRALDEEYEAWCDERRKKFSDEYNTWRKNRSQRASASPLRSAGSDTSSGSGSSGSSGAR